MKSIRLVNEADSPGLLKIYTPIVKNTAISFETQPPTESQFRQRISDLADSFPWLVYVDDERILGYAYAGHHRARAAYQWCTEVSAYVDAEQRRSGIGRVLYTSLLKILRLQGYFNAYAGITLPNPASTKFHEAMGFKLVGVYKDIGYKMAEWHDVGWWHLRLREDPSPPSPPIQLKQLLDEDRLLSVISEPVNSKQ